MVEPGPYKGIIRLGGGSTFGRDGCAFSSHTRGLCKRLILYVMRPMRATFPGGYVKCPFKLDNNGVVSDCQLVAGIPGVKVTEDGGVAPCMGWLVQKVARGKESD